MNKTFYLIPIISFIFSFSVYGEEIKSFDLGKGISVTIEEAKFNPDGHEIINCEGSEIPCTIDGIFPFGTSFALPRTYLKKLTLSIDDKTYDLDTSGMYNAWGSRPLEYKGSIKYLGAHCYNKNHCALRGLFSDAAGSFVAEWLIVNGKSMRTVITSSDDVVHLFIKNIEPPYYE